MGREIRRVPPNWEHPKKDDGAYQPMYDETFDESLKDWVEGYNQWKAGTHVDQKADHYTEGDKFWDWYGGPPNPKYYRPEFSKDAIWHQVYETVSEGTPVTPPFKTKHELVAYLARFGDFWDQRRGDGGWNKENAEGFVEREWAMSGMLIVTNDGADFKGPRDQ